MGGKKKTLANRLAKMSDEERARYVQHRAEIEEEARRRKEQLIAIFMKNKIKKEDGFSRLNLAKINQNWHQILRISKCKEMRQDVGHLKEYIDRVLNYKNRTIQKLLEELEMAEEQYCHNFQTHFIHIDQTIDSQKKDMESMDRQYRKDLNDILATTTKELNELRSSSSEQHHHLKTVIFGLQNKFNEASNTEYERFLKRKEELTSTFRLQLGAMIKRRQTQCASIWRQIAEATKSHVDQTDPRRLQLAELKRLDAESAAEIASNQERIIAQEEEIRVLDQQFETLTKKREESLNNLTKRIDNETGKLFEKRKLLRKQLENEEKLLVCLADKSNGSLEALERIKRKGEQIVNLMRTCRKFETPKEQITKWMSLEPVSAIREQDLEAVRERKKADKSEEIGVVISRREAGTSSRSKEEEIVKREFTLMDDLEMFWMMFSKADLDCKELRREKKVLLEQNKHFRGMIRSVLEAVALDRSKPTSTVSTRAASKKGSRSAPLRRLVV